jgi:hypothetical protein
MCEREGPRNSRLIISTLVGSDDVVSKALEAYSRQCIGVTVMRHQGQAGAQ